jgi:hypothetical protein
MDQYTINTEQVTWELTDGEAVVIHFETSAYYGLNVSGTYLWLELANGPVGSAELAAKIAARYGKRLEEITPDVDTFLRSLKIEDLLVEDGKPGAAPARTAELSSPKDTYQPPSLTKFGELEKLILSGE